MLLQNLAKYRVKPNIPISSQIKFLHQNQLSIPYKILPIFLIQQQYFLLHYPDTPLILTKISPTKPACLDLKTEFLNLCKHSEDLISRLRFKEIKFIHQLPSKFHQIHIKSFSRKKFVSTSRHPCNSIKFLSYTHQQYIEHLIRKYFPFQMEK